MITCPRIRPTCLERGRRGAGAVGRTNVARARQGAHDRVARACERARARVYNEKRDGSDAYKLRGETGSMVRMVTSVDSFKIVVVVAERGAPSNTDVPPSAFCEPATQK